MRTFDPVEWFDIEERLRQVPKITLEDFKSWLDIAESKSKLDAKYGFDEWTLSQALDLMLQPAAKRRSKRLGDTLTKLQRQQLDREDQRFRDSQRERREYNQADAPAEGPADFESSTASTWSGVPQEEFDRRVEERLAEYAKWYKDIAPNDMALLKNLCFVEVSIAILNALNAAEFAKSEPDSATINRYSQALKGLNEQALSMQRNLHIDRATREREAARLSEVDEALAEIDAAGEYVEEHAIPLVHEHCVTEGVIGESKFLFGYLVWDFLEIEIAVTWTCPRCGQQTHLIHHPKPGDLKAVEPDWVHEEEQEFIAREQAMKTEEDKDGE